MSQLGMNMDKNVGGYDRIGRFVIGTALVIVGIVGYAGMLRVAAGPIPQTLMALLLVLVGGILLATGYTQKCTMNRVLGIDTFKPRER